jgi:hypothetical protein
MGLGVYMYMNYYGLGVPRVMYVDDNGSGTHSQNEGGGPCDWTCK